MFARLITMPWFIYSLMACGVLGGIGGTVSLASQTSPIVFALVVGIGGTLAGLSWFNIIESCLISGLSAMAAFMLVQFTPWAGIIPGIWIGLSLEVAVAEWMDRPNVQASIASALEKRNEETESG